MTIHFQPFAWARGSHSRGTPVRSLSLWGMSGMLTSGGVGGGGGGGGGAAKLAGGVVGGADEARSGPSKLGGGRASTSIVWWAARSSGGREAQPVSPVNVNNPSATAPRPTGYEACRFAILALCFGSSPASRNG